MNLEDILPTKDLINSRGIRKFIRQFAKNDNWHNLDIDSSNLGYGWIHYSFIRVLQPARILVVGSRYGFIPALLGLACRDNGKGVVDFVDAGFDQANPQHKNHWGGVGYWGTKEGAKSFAKFNLQKHLRPHIMITADFKQKFPKKTWGYIYLDGDHSYNGTMSDFKRFWLKLNSGGLMLFHDIHKKEEPELDYGVYKFWREIKSKKRYNTLEFPGEFGLGIIQKL